MKKALIIISVLLFFAVTTSAQTPTYKELSATAYRLLKEQDYIGAQGKRGQVIFALSDRGELKLFVITLSDLFCG